MPSSAEYIALAASRSDTGCSTVLIPWVLVLMPVKLDPAGQRRFSIPARLVVARDREPRDQREDAREEDVAGAGGAEAEAAVLVAVLGHEVADRGAQRPGHDVGEPEGQHGVGAEPVVGEGDQRDDAAEDGDRDAVAEAELLGDEVAGGGAEREGEQ